MRQLFKTKARAATVVAVAVAIVGGVIPGQRSGRHSSDGELASAHAC
jgi:hypothetical protein